MNELIGLAKAARHNAVAPFSGFLVGAALETHSGKIFTGCNVENSSYGLTICAERVAIFKAVSEGEREFRRICVVADAEVLTSPCGACRQIIWEFCGDIPVILSNLRGESRVFQTLELLPIPFDSECLGKP